MSEGISRFFPKKRELPDGLWIKCPDCNGMLYKKEVENQKRVCPNCKFHFTLSPEERVSLLIDEGTFEETDRDLSPVDVIGFEGALSYPEKIKEAQAETGRKDACVTGTGKLNGVQVALGITDSRFMMGSMGSVVGEKITRAFELGHDKKLPVIIVSGSGGGARMYEGPVSLMQMAKTSAAVARFREDGGLYISILTNPTMAGVMASFASIADILIAEPKALLGFTGPRVIAQTIKQELPPGFQTSEFMLEHGFIDMVVERKFLKEKISQILTYVLPGNAPATNS
jgi:acetyl-CoA carboxylase carboxyl transferase subunit beta